LAEHPSSSSTGHQVHGDALENQIIAVIDNANNHLRDSGVQAPPNVPKDPRSASSRGASRHLLEQWNAYYAKVIRSPGNKKRKRMEGELTLEKRQRKQAEERHVEEMKKLRKQAEERHAEEMKKLRKQLQDQNSS